MNVKQLIEQLQQYDDNDEVMFTYNYGDHWRTEVAQRVRNVEQGMVVRSDYHNMDKVVDYDDEENEGTEARGVILIKG